jgi:GrpB-like predicted nucleotidyltransferase (UPF0157 family)
MTLVELHPHPPQWANLARVEIARLREALGDLIVTEHHLGSNSNPGVIAKPIIEQSSCAY